jgi:hypothetical protein
VLSGKADGDELIVFTSEDIIVTLYFWNGTLISGMTCQQGTTTFYTGDMTSVPLIAIGVAA